MRCSHTADRVICKDSSDSPFGRKFPKLRGDVYPSYFVRTYRSAAMLLLRLAAMEVGCNGHEPVMPVVTRSHAPCSPRRMKSGARAVLQLIVGRPGEAESL